MPGGKQQDQSCRSGGNRAWLCLSMGLSVLPGLSLCVLGSSGPLSVPPLHPGCPLGSIPSPGVYSGGHPHPLVCFVPCPGTPGPWQCLSGLPTALTEPFGVHRTSPWDFLCHRALGCAHPSVCEQCLGVQCILIPLAVPWQCKTPDPRKGTWVFQLSPN